MDGLPGAGAWKGVAWHCFVVDGLLGPVGTNLLLGDSQEPGSFCGWHGHIEAHDGQHGHGTVTGLASLWPSCGLGPEGGVGLGNKWACIGSSWWTLLIGHQWWRTLLWPPQRRGDLLGQCCTCCGGAGMKAPWAVRTSALVCILWSSLGLVGCALRGWAGVGVWRLCAARVKMVVSSSQLEDPWTLHILHG